MVYLHFTNISIIAGISETVNNQNLRQNITAGLYHLILHAKQTLRYILDNKKGIYGIFIH